MPTYQITGNNNEGMGIVYVHVDSIDQNQHVIDEITVVNAVRACLAAAPGVQSVLAQKYDQVITVI